MLKKKNYQKNNYQKNLENTLTDAKDLFKENYQNYKIMHIIINSYIIDGKYHKKLTDNLKPDTICIEVQFISISNKLISDINKVVKTYQINIISYLDQNYINRTLEDNKIDLPKKAHLVRDGFNENEVQVVPKKHHKTGFFEKFFQLFS